MFIMTSEVLYACKNFYYIVVFFCKKPKKYVMLNELELKI